MTLASPSAEDSITALVADLERYNSAYRSGTPLIDDNHYDRLVERLRRLDPSHPFLHQVEPERFSGKRPVRHPEPMLSTQKAYEPKQLERFVERVAKAAVEIGLVAEQVRYRITPKLDGLAGRDDGRVFASRGNGLMGYDITSAFEKGVVPVGGRGKGVGEIVAVKSYFDAELADHFDHPRNMVVGIVSAERDALNENAARALDAGMVHFVPYGQLPCREIDGGTLQANAWHLSADLAAEVDYPLDGAVAEAVDPALKAHMGATTHHYRWQIAVKSKGETGKTTVREVQWQVGRTGKLTPVMAVDPLPLSGATIRRVTAHNAAKVREEGIGPGARIEVIRSGEVIPKLEAVLAPADRVDLPEDCPVCGERLHWAKSPQTGKDVFLVCGNFACGAQLKERLRHWFRTLGTADWYGVKTIERLVASGVDSLEKLYTQTQEDFVAMGFGPVQSENLVQALSISRTEPIEDWRFLAAFGISNLGLGDSRKLLAHCAFEALRTLDHDQIKAIKGFGDTKSANIIADLAQLAPLMDHMLALGFNLQRTPLAAESPVIESPIAGKGIVFTGKLRSGSRSDLQAQARELGARVQTAVAKSTDYLVCGEKVGAKKIAKAEALGVQTLTEAAYLDLIRVA
ncbi:MAG: helix-hairpin-helix domain-containing protein [Desulfosarcinaceae bacterium]|nr:helix-hairpin-helix domain-containing protein [Desulfosarcinaceae bacterium]